VNQDKQASVFILQLPALLGNDCMRSMRLLVCHQSRLSLYLI